LGSLLVSLFLAACASGAGGSGAAAPAQDQPAGDAVTIVVNNDAVPPANITVWIAPESGPRRRLGTISSNGRQNFTFTPSTRSMEHRLVAEKQGGDSQTSNPFVLEGVNGVRWSISSPVVALDRGLPD
jgi:hypothetical protein